MTIRVRIGPEASTKLAQYDLWWRENRPAAANQVVDEIDRIVAVVQETPAKPP